jgi:hypothetical protein
MATQSNNFILIERDASSPIRGQQRSIDAADDIVLAPATVSIQPTGNVAINSSSGTLSMGNSASTQAINIGTAGARIITIGQGVGTGPTIVLNGVTNATQIESNGVLAIGSNYVGAETVYIGSGNLGVFAQTRTINIGNTTSGSGVNLYAGSSSSILLSGPIQLSSATNQITIAATSGSVSIDATTNGGINLGTNGGTGAIAIGTAATNRIITLGNATNTSPFNINAGTGGISLSTNATAGTINLGTDNGTGTISVGTGTGARAINIGTGAANGTISIGTSANTGRTVTIGNSAGTSRLILSSGSAGITITAGSTSGNIQLGNDAGTGNIDIASGASATSARFIQVATGGTGAKTLTMGSTASTSSTVIQTGTGAMTFTAGGAYDVNAVGAVTIDSSGGTIGIGTDAVSQSINIGTAGTRFITIGGTANTSFVAIRPGFRAVVLTAGSQGTRGIGYEGTNRSGANYGNGTLLAHQVSPAADQVNPQFVLASAAAGGVTSIRRVAAISSPSFSIADGSNGIVTSFAGGICPMSFDVAPAGGADIGKPVYLSTTAGMATLTAPSGSGETIFQVGILARGVADANSNWFVQFMPQFIADIP